MSAFLCPPQHLDCVFNIVGDDVCLLAEDVIGEASPMRRVVDVYERDVRPPRTPQVHPGGPNRC